VVVLDLCTPRDHMDSFRAISKEANIVMRMFFGLHEFGAAIQAFASGQTAPQALVSDTVRSFNCLTPVKRCAAVRHSARC